MLGYEGTVAMGYIDPSETLVVQHAHFVAGLRPPSGYEVGREQKLTLKTVDPIVLSEVLHDLARLAERARS